MLAEAIDKLTDLAVPPRTEIYTDARGRRTVAVINGMGGYAETFDFGDKSIRVSETFRAADRSSLVGYLERHRTDNLLMSADYDKRSIECILDYHSDDGETGWCEHRANLHPSFSPEFEAWKSNNGLSFEQRGFAEFIEDHVDDISDIPSAEMLELVTKLRASQRVDFRSDEPLANGDTLLHYEVKTNATAGQLTIPDHFEITIPVFDGESCTTFRCRYRYEIKDGALRLSYRMLRVSALCREAFDFVVDGLEQTVGVQILRGSISQG